MESEALDGLWSLAATPSEFHAVKGGVLYARESQQTAMGRRRFADDPQRSEEESGGWLGLGGVPASFYITGLMSRRGNLVSGQICCA